MNPWPSDRLAISRARSRASSWGSAVPLLVLVTLLLPSAGHAAPYMWDQDQDGIDDRLTDVFQNGINHAYENLDPDGRLRFEVALAGSLLEYGGYVRFTRQPTPADSATMAFLGAQVVTRFASVPYIRVRALYPTLVLIAARPEVERVEAVSIMYSMNWKAGRALAVRRGGGAPYPTVEETTGLTGAGVVVAVLDTGINDTSQGAYPGHVDLAGKVLGGAFYGGPGPSGYTPRSESVNPSQTAGGLTSYHGTHVAGSIAGGSRSRTIGGIAPGARLLDVKVLDDNGSGSGLAEGLEWCLQNHGRDWGPDAGIDVINLSVSGTDPSDGNDCVCALVDTAAAAGILVVASAGNDGTCGAIAAPGAADGALTVGACDGDTLTGFSNEGPRDDDQDGGHFDEMKPDVTAPGVDVISAFGSPAGTGYGYVAASGTSQAAALVSGVVALLREENATLTPEACRELLRDTAAHRGGPTRACSAGPDPFGIDPRYHPGWGYGLVDALAAEEELTRPDRTQFVRLSAQWNPGAAGVDVSWTTQREADLTGFIVLRAPDAGGGPGSFVPVTPLPVPATGFSDLATGNRTTYYWSDATPPGGLYWYQVATTGGGTPDFSPARQASTFEPAGTARMSFVHNTPGTDLVLGVGSGSDPTFPDWGETLDVPTFLETVSVSALNPADVSYQLSVPLYDAEAYLPPSVTHPWWFTAAEGGDPGRSGSLTAFSVDTGGQTYPTDSVVPRPTVEGFSTTLWIPQPVISDANPSRDITRQRLLAAYPNPFQGTATLRLTLDAPEELRLCVLDVSGRLVRSLAAGNFDTGAHDIAWDGRDDSGTLLPAGRYYLRLQRPRGVQVLSVVYLP